MPTTLAAKEDLNFNRIVSKQFDRAAQYLKIHPALLAQIKACNNVYYFQFPVRFGGDEYEIFEGWRAEHSQHKKPVKGGTRFNELVSQDEIMIESAASIAPFSPPLTGASTIRTPIAESSAATFCETSGLIVLISMNSCPLFAPSFIPLGPSATNSTSGELGSMVIITSLRCATSCEFAAVCAPSLTNSSTTARLRL